MAVVGLAFVVPTSGPLIGNIWTAGGPAGSSVLGGTRQAVIGGLTWSASKSLAVLAGILAAGLVLSWAHGRPRATRSAAVLWARTLEIARRPTAVLPLFLIAYGAALAYWASRLSVFDRYLYPMVPPAAILLLRGTSSAWRLGRAQAVVYASLIWLALASLMITANSFAYDDARWRAGEAAVAMGYAPDTIDAGYEWVGFHANAHVNTVPAAYGRTKYGNGLMASKPCAVVSNTPFECPGLHPGQRGSCCVPPVPGDRGPPFAVPVRFS